MRYPWADELLSDQPDDNIDAIEHRYLERPSILAFSYSVHF